MSVKAVRFRVFLHGQNALIETNGRPQRLGFYTTRIVEAASEEEAERQAIKLLKSDDWLNEALLNSGTDPFVLAAEEVDEVAPDEIATIGFSWYPMDDRDQ